MVGHKNSKIELTPNKEISKNFVFILKKDGINYLLVSTFDRSCFKIDLNGRVSYQRTSFKIMNMILTDICFAKGHPSNKKMCDFLIRTSSLKTSFLKKSSYHV